MRSKRYFALLVAAFSIVTLGFSQTHQEKIRFCYVGPNDLADVSAPKFEQYSVRTSPLRSIAKLDVKSNPIARMYRTVIRHEMNEGRQQTAFSPIQTAAIGASVSNATAAFWCWWE